MLIVIQLENKDFIYLQGWSMGFARYPDNPQRKQVSWKNQSEMSLPLLSPKTSKSNCPNISLESVLVAGVGYGKSQPVSMEAQTHWEPGFTTAHVHRSFQFHTWQLSAHLLDVTIRKKQHSACLGVKLLCLWWSIQFPFLYSTVLLFPVWTQREVWWALPCTSWLGRGTLATWSWALKLRCFW